MGVEVDGMGDVFEELDDLEDDYGDDGVEWVVGTPVEYAKYLEYGTTGGYEITPDDKDALAFTGSGGDQVVVAKVEHPGIDPQPFFRPAINEVRLQGPDGFIRHNTRKTFAEIDSTTEFVQTLAFALERRIKEIIRNKGLIDTGNLRASVGAVPIGDIADLKE